MAKITLRATQPEFYFNALDGSEIKSIPHLAHALDSMSDDVFHHHVTADKNDFSSWIKDVFKEKDLANTLSRKNTRLEAQVEVLKFILKKKR